MLKSDKISYLDLSQFSGKETPRRPSQNKLNSKVVVTHLYPSFTSQTKSKEYYSVDVHLVQLAEHQQFKTSRTFSIFWIKFSGSLVVLEQVKLGGFIHKNSRILEVSRTSYIALIYFTTWLVTTWMNIQIASQYSTLVTSPKGFTTSALGTPCSSLLHLEERLLTYLHGGMINL